MGTGGQTLLLARFLRLINMINIIAALEINDQVFFGDNLADLDLLLLDHDIGDFNL